MRIEKKDVKKIKLQHNKKLFWLIIVLMIILICLVLYIKSEKQKAEKECIKNEDCVKVQTTCCSCNMGGEEMCASRKNASEYIPNCPTENRLCSAMYNCKIDSCKCEEGKCTFVKKENEE